MGVNPLRGQNNVQGAADMGCQPHQGAGYFEVSDKKNQNSILKNMVLRIQQKQD